MRRCARTCDCEAETSGRICGWERRRMLVESQRRANTNWTSSLKGCDVASAPRKILTLLLCALLASSCASVQSSHRTPPPGPFETIKPGDRVVLQMREGHVEKVTVARIDGDTLIAKSGRVYARDEIVEIRRARRASWTTTILLLAGTLGGIALILNALPY